MKALITAGGRGSRLRPITYSRNKHLIPIANKPMIFYAIENVVNAGIKDIGINYNYDLEGLRAVVGNGERWGCHITYIHQESPTGGLADILKCAREFLEDDRFIFYLGDNIMYGDLKKYIDNFDSSVFAAYFLLSEVPDPQRFGVAIFDDKLERLIIEEKPKIPKSNNAVTGIYLYSSKVWESLRDIKPSERGELEITDVNNYMLDNYLCDYSHITGWWKDTGKLEDILEANQLIIDRQYPTTRYVIGENCEIDDDSSIGYYTSISNNCIIENSTIKNSIVLDGAVIRNVEGIENSIIGMNAHVEKINTGYHSFMIGDQSNIIL